MSIGKIFLWIMFVICCILALVSLVAMVGSIFAGEALFTTLNLGLSVIVFILQAVTAKIFLRES